MKCAICGKEVEKTFLEKIRGCYVHKNGKTYVVCSDCQKKYKNNYQEIISKI